MRDKIISLLCFPDTVDGPVKSTSFVDSELATSASCLLYPYASSL